MRKHFLGAEDAEFVGLLKACSHTKNLYTGTRLHAGLLKKGLLETSLFVRDALVYMYVKCGALLKANELLDGLHVQNVSSWNMTIAAFVQQGQCQDALDCFQRMRHEGISPNTVTFACILKACACIRAADKGEQIHDDIAKQGLLGSSIVLGTALVDMYAKCGSLLKAQQVLEKLPNRNVFSWTALISGFAQHGHGHDALKCYERMRQEGLSPDAVTFVSILKACGSIKAAEKGEKFHDEIVRKGLLRGNSVLLATLVDMYAKCGSLAKAREVLEDCQAAADVFSWTGLIGGYVEQGEDEEAFETFKEMKERGISPNAVTFACILKACGSVGAADKGEQIHDEISKRGLLKNDLVLGSALVDMYAKCGALGKAQQVREKLPAHDVVSWTALIAGYAQQGQIQEACSCFEQMEHIGLSPNALTFTCILNACSHSGLADEAEMYFALMRSKYGIEPELEHYTCMVDLFGRAGHLDRAISFLDKMPSDDYVVVWRSLLRACQKQQDVIVGRWAFEHALQIDNGDAALYDLMSNIYLAAGMQQGAETVKNLREENKAWTSPG